MSKVLIVDDTDPAITYSGSWGVGAAVGSISNEYNATVHYSTAAGDELSYEFYGTGISVYGTLDSPALTLNGPPNATFSIDGLAPTIFNSTTFVYVDSPDRITAYVQLYQSAVLEKKSHSLRIRSGSPQINARLYVDFFVVATGLDSAAGDIIVDDRDPSILYTGGWQDAGVPWEYGKTTRQAPDDAPGGQASFRFNGTSVTVFGTTTFTQGANTTAVINFSLDGNSGGTFTGEQDSYVIQHIPLFHAEGLSNTEEHNVVMTSLTTNRWYLDYIVYKTQNSAVVGDVVAGGDSGNQNKQNVGPIVGGVVAAVVALLAIAGIYFILRRRRKLKLEEDLNRQNMTEAPPGSNPTLVITPFSVQNTDSQAHLQPLPNKRYDSSTTNIGLASGSRGPQNLGPQGNAAPPTSYLSGSSSAYSSAPATSQYSDAESQQGPIPSPPLQGHAQAFTYQPLHNPLYPGFDPGAGGIISAPQHDSQHYSEQRTGQGSGQKARFTRSQGSPPGAPTSAMHRPPRPPSGALTIEEDSGIRLPRTSPPVYTPD